MAEHLRCDHVAREDEPPHAVLPFPVEGKPVYVCEACWDMMRAQMLQDAITQGVKYAFLGDGGLKTYSVKD